MRLVLGLALALIPLESFPLGLGKLKVNSALNEPLNGDIEFSSISEKELKGLEVGLAARADFIAAGAERVPIVSQIKFTVAKRLDGRYFVQLHTDEPFPEPFLHILVRVSWVGGQLVREYTALIDPPYLVAGRPGDVNVPTTDQIFAVAPAPVPAVPEPMPELMRAGAIEALESPPRAVIPSGAGQTANARSTNELLGPALEAMPNIEISPSTGWPVAAAGRGPRVIEPMGPSSTPVWSNASEYRVKKGDTLWGIAQRVRADRQLSMEQVMLAIFQQNRGAFFGSNVNNLRAGKILTMPERERVTTVSKSSASKEFRAQYDVWQEYKLKLASANRTIKVAQEAPAPEPAKPALKAKAKPVVPPKAEKRVPPKAAKKVEPAPKAEKSVQPAEKGGAQSDELLKIVRSNLDDKKAAPGKNVAQSESAKAAAKTERQALEERVTTLEESIESKELETKELSGKLGQVRAHLKNEARLIEIDNEKMAKAQKQPVPEASTAPPPAESAKPAPPVAVEPAKPAPAPAEPVKAAKPPAPTAPKKTVVVPPPPAPEKDLLATVMDTVMDVIGMENVLLPLVGVVAALFGGGILLVYLHRRRKSIAEFEESILASDAMSGDTGTTVDTAGQAAATGDTSFLSDFSQGGMGNIHTDEVDPIAEADVYLAYGRDETAEEILRDAIVKHPQRQELKQKLLEIYHQRNDVGAFETLAEELYAAAGGRGGPIWKKVEEMGRKLNPNNPMFRGGDAASTAAAGAGMLPAMHELAPPPSEEFKAETSLVDVKPVEPSPGSDFDFDIEGASAPSAEAKSGGIDFDLELGAEALAAGSAAKPERTADASLDTGLDFTPEPAEVRASGMESVALDQPASSELSRSAELENAIDFNFDGEKSGSADLAFDVASGADDGEIKWDVDTAPPDAGLQVASDTDSETAVAEETQQQWDETATKLDLAKAYIDMGDAEGARSILEEVLAEGTDDQKKQAAELATQIA